MKISLDKEELYTIIKEAVKDALQEEKLEFFLKAMAKSGADKDAQMLVRRGKHTRYAIIEAKPAVQQPPTPKIVDVELSGAKGRILNIKLLILC